MHQEKKKHSGQHHQMLIKAKKKKKKTFEFPQGPDFSLKSLYCNGTTITVKGDYV